MQTHGYILSMYTQRFGCASLEGQNILIDSDNKKASVFYGLVITLNITILLVNVCINFS